MLPIITLLLNPALAFEVRTDELGQTVQWKRHTIRYKVNPEGDHGLSDAAIETLIGAATREWTNPVSGNLAFSNAGNTTLRSAAYEDKTNVIYFEDQWKEDPTLLAVTYLWSTTEGEMIGFDMALNAQHHQWAIDGNPESNDLLNTLSHEFGHALGIDHSPIVELATMYPSSPIGEVTKRDLHDDDIDAVMHLYAGANHAESTTPAGCSTVREPAHSALLWLCLPLIAIRRRTDD